MRQRMRRVIPLRHVADESRRVLRAVDPGHFARTPLRGIEDVTENHDHRNAVTKGIVDSHRCVLRPDSAVTAYQRRLACDLGVAMGHRCGKIFVCGQDELRIFVAAIVDDRLLQGHIGISGNAKHVFEAQAFYNVHHEVGAGPINGHGFVDNCSRRRRRSRQDRCAGVPGLWSRLLRPGPGSNQSRTRGRGL